MTMTEVRPYIGKVAVVDPSLSSQTESGIILPAGFEKLMKGVIVGVGPEVPSLDEGNLIWYPGGVGVEIEGMTIVNCTDIIAFSQEM